MRGKWTRGGAHRQEISLGFSFFIKEEISLGIYAVTATAADSASVWPGQAMGVS
jgi:hypothetical protein